MTTTIHSPRTSGYADLIREDLARIGRIGTSPADVEAWMRLEHSTLDALSPQQFRAEVAIACECIDALPSDQMRMLRESYGL